MAFNGDGQKLVGDDGFLQLATFGTEIPGDGATPLPVGTYLITKVAGTSAFPAPALGGSAAAEGDIITIVTGDSVTPAVDDDVVTLTLADKCDVSDWTMEFSKEEIEVTTLCDAVKKYRAGKADMTGTFNGVFLTGTTDGEDGPLRQFIRIVKQDGDTSYDSFDQQEAILLAFFYVNNDTASTDKMWVAAAIQLYGESLGGEIGSAQTFSSPFRFGNLTYTDTGNSNTVTIEPTFYRLGS